MNTATLVRSLSDYTGDARLYRLDQPIEFHKYEGDDYVAQTADYVVVSATCAMFTGPETYIFPADKDGEILNWTELDGSFRGSLDHVAALAGAGYKAVQL